MREWMVMMKGGNEAMVKGKERKGGKRGTIKIRFFKTFILSKE